MCILKYTAKPFFLNRKNLNPNSFTTCFHIICYISQYHSWNHLLLSQIRDRGQKYSLKLPPLQKNDKTSSLPRPLGKLFTKNNHFWPKQSYDLDNSILAMYASQFLQGYMKIIWTFPLEETVKINLEANTQSKQSRLFTTFHHFGNTPPAAI